MVGVWRWCPLNTAGVLIRAKAEVDMLRGYDRAHGWRDLLQGGFDVLQSEGDDLSILTDEHAVFLSEKNEFSLRRHEELAQAHAKYFTRAVNPRAASPKSAQPSQEKAPNRDAAITAPPAV
jgi:hypothetical protein